MNLSKSKMFISPNFSCHLAKEISHICNIPLTADLGKYLGVPLIHSRVSKETYFYVLDKVQNHLFGWKADHLSMAGRTLLVQSVTSAIPGYVMQSSKLPEGLLNQLDRVNCKFIWGSTESNKKIHLVVWDKICLPKDQGGLGIHNLSAVNKSYMARMEWKFLSERHSLWVSIFKSKYLKHTPFLDYNTSVRSSHSWRSILQGREIVKEDLITFFLLLFLIKLDLFILSKRRVLQIIFAGSFLRMKNRRLFEAGFSPPPNLVEVIMSRAKEWVSSSRLAKERLVKSVRYIAWSFPPLGWVKLNTYGSSRGNPGESAGEGLLRDDAGNWMVGFCVNIGVCSVTGAKLWALFHGLKIAWDEGVHKVIVAIDSAIVVNFMRYETERIIHRDWECIVEHNFREGNQFADCLANSSHRLPHGVSIFRDPPSEVLVCIRNDMMGVTTPRSV
ncbi:hypothetical protein L1049_028358 [Liquidambar formosana]|uniref:RNase H type-1 domain-containing protein n=1 Tax=Liquidambar formosana TaxID=63359 RepID=A0AAP0RKS6_LIQFO